MRVYQDTCPFRGANKKPRPYTGPHCVWDKDQGRRKNKCGLRSLQKDPLTNNREQIEMGPIRLRLVRFSRGVAGPVCQYTFTAQSHACVSQEASRDKLDCCSSHTYGFPRGTASDYKPNEQVNGHGCKQWYLGSLALVQALYGATTSLGHVQRIGKCLVGCSRWSHCDKNYCNKDPACKWNPTATLKFQVNKARKGLCQARK